MMKIPVQISLHLSVSFNVIFSIWFSHGNYRLKTACVVRLMYFTSKDYNDCIVIQTRYGYWIISYIAVATYQWLF
jgi:hypothetical protein